jgi:hypothetical protein
MIQLEILHLKKPTRTRFCVCVQCEYGIRIYKASFRPLVKLFLLASLEIELCNPQATVKKDFGLIFFTLISICLTLR